MKLLNRMISRRARIALWTGAFAVSLLARPLELSAWPGMFWSSASATCACVPRTAPSGNLLATATLSGAGVVDGTFTASNVTSPACTTTGGTFVEDTANSQHIVNPKSGGGSISVSLSNSQVTFIIFVKQGAGTRTLDIQVLNAALSGDVYMGVNPATGAITFPVTLNGGFGSSAFATVDLADNGWYKVIISVAGVTTTGLFFELMNDNGTTGSSNTYTGDGSSGFQYYGAAVSTP